MLRSNAVIDKIRTRLRLHNVHFVDFSRALDGGNDDDVKSHFDIFIDTDRSDGFRSHEIVINSKIELRDENWSKFSLLQRNYGEYYRRQEKTFCLDKITFSNEFILLAMLDFRRHSYVDEKRRINGRTKSNSSVIGRHRLAFVHFVHPKCEIASSLNSLGDNLIFVNNKT